MKININQTQNKEWSRMGPRAMFGQFMIDIAKKNEKLIVLSADLGRSSGLDRFKSMFPKKYLSVGISEQNLIGVASGLINLNFKVVVYTISNFLVHRCFEQLRNDISLHKKPILMIGTSCGYDNASLGPTHHVIDDWGYIKNLPNFVCPNLKLYNQDCHNHRQRPWNGTIF